MNETLLITMLTDVNYASVALFALIITLNTKHNVL